MNIQFPYPPILLAAIACSLCVAPAAAQQGPQPAQPADADRAAQPMERAGIIVVGGKPVRDAGPSARDADPVALNPQPLPPRQPYPPPVPRAAPQATALPDSADRAGIIVVGGKAVQPAAGHAQPATVPAARNKQLRKAGGKSGR